MPSRRYSRPRAKVVSQSVASAYQAALTGLTEPFDLEVRYGERVAVLGSNGSGKSQFLKLPAGRPGVPHEGTVPAVTHDRWFAEDFDRYLVFGADGGVRESPDPVWTG